MMRKVIKEMLSGLLNFLYKFKFTLVIMTLLIITASVHSSPIQSYSIMLSIIIIEIIAIIEFILLDRPKVKIGIQLLDHTTIPKTATSNSNGMDCNLIINRINKHILKDMYDHCRGFAITDFKNERVLTISPNGKVIMPLGFKLKLPKDILVKVLPKSGIGLKSDLIIPNSPGLIDEDYRGEVMCILRNTGTKPIVLKDGKAICQILFERATKIEFYNTFVGSDTDRGEGGHGSTGSALDHKSQ